MNTSAPLTGLARPLNRSALPRVGSRQPRVGCRRPRAHFVRHPVRRSFCSLSFAATPGLVRGPFRHPVNKNLSPKPRNYLNYRSQPPATTHLSADQKIVLGRYPPQRHRGGVRRRARGLRGAAVRENSPRCARGLLPPQHPGEVCAAPTHGTTPPPSLCSAPVGRPIERSAHRPTIERPVARVLAVVLLTWRPAGRVPVTSVARSRAHRRERALAGRVQRTSCHVRSTRPRHKVGRRKRTPRSVPLAHRRYLRARRSQRSVSRAPRVPEARLRELKPRPRLASVAALQRSSRFAARRAPRILASDEGASMEQSRSSVRASHRPDSLRPSVRAPGKRAELKRFALRDLGDSRVTDARVSG